MSAFDHTSIDDVIHGKVRLGIMAYLSTAESATFKELRDKVNATDGNLSVQISKLEEAGYVRVEKSFQGKKPLTRVALTKHGRDAWIAYLGRLQALLNAAE